MFCQDKATVWIPPRFLAALLALGLAGCASAPKAEVVTDVPDAIEAPAGTESYELGADALDVEVDVSAGSSYTIKFPRSTGKLVLSPAKLEASTVDVVVDAASAESTLQLVADIAKDQFLHTHQHPSARFSSRAIRKSGEGYMLYGDLDLHGTKKSLVVPLTVEVDACRVRFACSFEIDRRAFGAVSDGSLDGVVSDSVEVRIDVDTPRKSAPAKCVENVAKR
jgi:polyisoprenoid-binding protein YceI